MISLFREFKNVGSGVIEVDKLEPELGIKIIKSRYKCCDEAKYDSFDILAVNKIDRNKKYERDFSFNNIDSTHVLVECEHCKKKLELTYTYKTTFMCDGIEDVKIYRAKENTKEKMINTEDAVCSFSIFSNNKKIDIYLYDILIAEQHEQYSSLEYAYVITRYDLDDDSEED